MGEHSITDGVAAALQPDAGGADDEASRTEILEQYKLYVEMADRASARRLAANSFFVTVNAAILGIAGAVLAREGSSLSPFPYWPASLAGAILCWAWLRIIRSYRGLNTAKFAVINEIEKRLPIRPYSAEWEAMGRGEDSKRYKPLSHVEIAVPWVFLVVHITLAVCFLLMGRMP
jgi:hypothetical protein